MARQRRQTAPTAAVTAAITVAIQPAVPVVTIPFPEHRDGRPARRQHSRPRSA